MHSFGEFECAVVFRLHPPGKVTLCLCPSVSSSFCAPDSPSAGLGLSGPLRPGQGAQACVLVLASVAGSFLMTSTTLSTALLPLLTADRAMASWGTEAPALRSFGVVHRWPGARYFRRAVRCELFSLRQAHSHRRSGAHARRSPALHLGT